MTKVKVTRNYQITIPDDVRKRVRLKEGETVEVEALDPQSVLVKRVIPLEELEGAWKDEPRIGEVMKEVADLWKSWKIRKSRYV